MWGLVIRDDDVRFGTVRRNGGHAMPSRNWAAVLVLACLLAIIGEPAEATEFPCGDAGCVIDGGVYHIALPDAPRSGSVPAVMFFHGYGGQAASVMGNQASSMP